MIYKAIIEQIVDKYSYRVRIPERHKISTATGAVPTNELPIACISIVPGIKPSFSLGEVVLVEFEKDIWENPVIIGSLLSKNSGNSAIDIQSNSLNVTGKTVLSKDTQIGDITADRLSQISFLINQGGAGGSDSSLRRRVDAHDLDFSKLYDKNSHYVVDNIIIYDSILYKCIKPTTGKFNESCWQKINVADQLKDLRDLIISQMQNLRISIHESTVEIPTNWQPISDDKWQIEVNCNFGEFCKDDTSVICSYSIHSGDFDIQANREAWLESDIYLKSHKSKSASTVILTFIANNDKPTSIIYADVLSIADKQPSDISKMAPVYISDSEPVSSEGEVITNALWLDTTENKFKIYDYTQKKWVITPNDYYTKDEIDELFDKKQDKLNAGNNIQINGDIISATDTTYQAGQNITIVGTTISATDTQYIAGDNIQIDGGIISATDTRYTAGNNITISDSNVISAETGTIDYNKLENKPQINGITLEGNKTAEQLKIVAVFG